SLLLPPTDNGGGDLERAADVAEPPREPERRGLAARRETTEKERRHAHGRAHGRAGEAGIERESGQVAGALEGRGPAGEARHQKRPDDRFERIAEGDSERGERSPRRGPID